MTQDTTGRDAADPARAMLSEHIPLSLIMDMASPEGPRSAELLEAEGLPEDAWWEQDASRS
ncbi:hypothetical protein [Kineococcus sp. SYSU DK004]|uniref:hypothetical protein n=1 Tax=Kineococcus sp. SYSU DK004 TaxID=3383125 RepID=UPI003D7E6E43